MMLALLILLGLLALGDVATTAYGLARGAEEANPLVSGLFARLRGWKLVAAMILLKLAGLSLFAALLLLYPSWWPLPALYAASLALIVANNIRVIRGT